MKTHSAKTLLEGFTFGEGPRWHAGKLWFSDMFGEKVMTLEPNGRAETLFSLATRPSGLGFDAKGRLLVVSMADRRVLRWEGSKLELVADLSSLVPAPVNDMVVSREGRAYCGNFGYDLLAGEEAKTTVLICIDPDGRARPVADELLFPNGMVLSADGKTLVVAETFADRLTAFDVGADGSLSGRRVFAEIPGKTPDGICGDAEGAIWVSGFNAEEFIRVKQGGEIVERVPTPGKKAVACVLGGEDRRTLFLCTAETSLEELHEGKSKGRIETVRVDVPGAGIP
jgi:sugar lactone lactonase YvrE